MEMVAVVVAAAESEMEEVVIEVVESEMEAMTGTVMLFSFLKSRWVSRLHRPQPEICK